jgi:hypothetical protein
MAKYRVGFDGKWQEDFDIEGDALGWAREVSETGRLVWVLQRRFLRWKLLAVFPEERFEEGQDRWRAATLSIDAGGYSSGI